LLDLLGDAPLPGAGGAPLSSGVVLKASAPAPLEKPEAKKKKKKKKSGSDGLSDNTQVLFRMSGGALLVLLGLGLIGVGIYGIVGRTQDEGVRIPFVRWWILGGLSVIGSGIKLVVG